MCSVRSRVGEAGRCQTMKILSLHACGGVAQSCKDVSVQARPDKSFSTCHRSLSAATAKHSQTHNTVTQGHLFVRECGRGCKIATETPRLHTGVCRHMQHTGLYEHYINNVIEAKHHQQDRSRRLNELKLRLLWMQHDQE